MDNEIYKLMELNDDEWKTPKNHDKRVWFDFDIDIQIGLSFTIYLDKEWEIYSCILSIMCFNFYGYWWNRR